MKDHDVPQDLLDLIVDFATSCIVHEPPDLIAHGVQFFAQVCEKNRNLPRSSIHKSSTLKSKFGKGQPCPKRKNNENYLRNQIGRIRREAICSEQYNPEDDKEYDCSQSPMLDEKLENLKNKLEDVFIFQTLDSRQLTQVVNAMALKQVEPDEILIEEGDESDYFYVIETGNYNIYINSSDGTKTLVGNMDNEGTFGALSLMYNRPHPSTIIAETKGSTWILDGPTFRRIVMKNSFEKRLRHEKFLKDVELLSSLSLKEIELLSDGLKVKEYEDNDKIIEQDDDADGMYFIEEGKVIIKKNADGEEIEVDLLEQNDYFGEFSLITDSPRMASVYAVGKVQVAFLDVLAFERLLGPCRDILLRDVQHYEDVMKCIKKNGQMV